MSLLSRLSAWFTRASAAGPVIAAQVVGQAQYAPNDYLAAVRRVRAHPVAFRCLRLIGKAAASVTPIVVVDGVEVEAGENGTVGHPLAEIIRRPNPLQGWNEIVEASIGFLHLHGNAYLEAGENTITKATPELYVLRPERVRLIPDNRGLPAAYEYEVNGQRVRFDMNVDAGELPILHVRDFSPTDDWFGMGCLAAASNAMDLYTSGRDYQKAILDNGGRASGLIKYGGDERLSKEQAEDIRDQVQSLYGGVKNAGRVLVLSGGLEYTQLGLKPVDLQGAELRDAAAREIALAFGVPPMVLGIPGDNTYANYQEANRAFWRETMLPLLSHFYGALGRWASTRFGSNVEVRIDPDSIPALAEEVARKWDAATKADFLTVDEKRELVGYEELDGGTGAAVLVEASKVPLGSTPDANEDDPADDDFGDPEARGAIIPLRR